MSFVISIQYPIIFQTFSVFSFELSQPLYRFYNIDIVLKTSVVILILIYYKLMQIIFTNYFIETAVSIGFIPKITLPTRIGEASYRSTLRTK